MMEAMKPRTLEMIEGPEAYKRFEGTLRRLLSVPKTEILRREVEYKKKAALNPNKRGPKPKAKS
jgi:hypothetical protein